jgi:branched-chain amino acid transport system permease protein
MLNEATRAVWGARPLSVQTPAVLSGSVGLGVTTIARFRLFTVVVGAVTVLAVYLLIERTDFGLSVRAGVLDREMAEFLGVNIPVRFVLMFALGAGIAGLGGVLRGTEVGMDVGMGNQFIILAFVVVVVGGAGSLFGSVVAGLLIGEAVFLTPLVLQSVADATSVGALSVPGIGGVMPYVVMITVLLVRPRGLFGQEGFLE